MFLLAIADTVLLVWTFRRWREFRHPVLGVLAFLILALPYDTALVGAGRWIGAGEQLEWLSGPRFTLFALSVPLILIINASLAKLAGFRWAQPRWFLGSVCLLATGFLVLSWRQILLFPDLYPACWADTLRYVPSVTPTQICIPGQAGVSLPGPLPVAAILALPSMVVLGAALWWRRRWPWLFVGTLAGLTFLGLPPATVGPIPGFLGDALNMLALVTTAVHFLRHPRPPTAPV
jgi:hypothetical protein